MANAQKMGRCWLQGVQSEKGMQGQKQPPLTGMHASRKALEGHMGCELQKPTGSNGEAGDKVGQSFCLLISFKFPLGVGSPYISNRG